MPAYTFAVPDGSIFFAAGEIANGVWGFFTPTPSMRDFLVRFHP